jgi:hypothetical protein
VCFITPGRKTLFNLTIPLAQAGFRNPPDYYSLLKKYGNFYRREFQHIPLFCGGYGF